MDPYVGRTAAYLEGADLIDTPHIAGALQHREREGQLRGRPGESPEGGAEGGCRAMTSRVVPRLPNV